MAKKEPRELDTLFPYVPIIPPGEKLIDKIINDPRPYEERRAETQRVLDEMDKEYEQAMQRIAELEKQGIYFTKTISPPYPNLKKKRR